MQNRSYREFIFSTNRKDDEWLLVMTCDHFWRFSLLFPLLLSYFLYSYQEFSRRRSQSSVASTGSQAAVNLDEHNAVDESVDDVVQGKCEF